MEKIKLSGSIRKSKLGVTGVLFFSSLLLTGILSSTELVSADEVVTSTQSTPTNDNSVPEPLVSTKVIEATTEYVADETKDYGTTTVITEAKNGSESAVTTYELVNSEVPKIDEAVAEKLNSEDYSYGPSDFYHIDDSQEKPSDKIIIDDLFSDVTPVIETDIQNQTSVRDLVTNASNSYYTSTTNEFVTRRDALLALTKQDNTGETIYLASESLNPENETFQDLLKSYSFDGFNLFMATGPISGEMTDSVKEAIYIEILRRSASNLMNLAGFKYITDLEPGDSESDAVKAYASSYPISEQLFADAKADFQRMQYASGKLGLANYVNSQNPNVISIIDTQKYGLEAFETITHRYNNENGYYEVPLTYENTSLSTENQQVYKEMIAKLPESIRSNILKLVVTDNQLPAADETDDPIAVNYYSIGSIYQEHLSELETSVLTPTGKKIIVMAHHQPLALMDNLLHELSHTVDRRSGTIVKDINLYKEGQTEKLMEAGRLSHSEDFINIFEEFFLPKEDLKIYMRYSPTEAFADSLGEYINHKLFGIPYTRYKKVDGVVYEYKPSYAGMSEEYDAMAETVYSIGYSPVEASESYWDALYKKLFEESGTTELVATTVTTKVPAQNGKILIGTKPKTEITVIQFETVEQEDSNQLVGYREIIQVGKNGQLQTLTTYTVDSVTGEVTAQTDTVVLSNVVNEIILIGTKVVENDSEKIVEKPSVNEVPSGDVVIQPKTPYKLSIDDLNDVVEEKSAVVETEDNKQTEVKLVTQRSSNQVIDRRQSQETYEAKLPNTGEASSVTYMLIGASLIALAAGTRKRRQG